MSSISQTIITLILLDQPRTQDHFDVAREPAEKGTKRFSLAPKFINESLEQKMNKLFMLILQLYKTL